MKLTSETLKKTCEEYKICGENQEKLVKEFFENYPDIELTERKLDYGSGKSVDYFSAGRCMLKFDVPTSSGINEGLAHPLGKAYFHGKKFDHVFLESGYNCVLPHHVKIIGHDGKWSEKIRSLLHIR